METAEHQTRIESKYDYRTAGIRFKMLPATKEKWMMRQEALSISWPGASAKKLITILGN